MAAPLNDQQRQEVEENAWKLRRRGFTTRRIAEELAKPADLGGIGIDVSHSTVAEALKRVETALHKEFVAEAAEIKARQTAQLEYVQELAMDSFEKSCQDAEQTRTKRTGIKTEDPKEGKAPTEVPGMYLKPAADGEGFDETDDDERSGLLLAAGMGADGAILPVIEQIHNVKGQSGDPRFLAEARNAMKDIRDIWGLNAPVKQDITSGGEKFAVIGYEIVPPSSLPSTDSE